MMKESWAKQMGGGSSVLRVLAWVLKGEEARSSSRQTGHRAEAGDARVREVKRRKANSVAPAGKQLTVDGGAA